MDCGDVAARQNLTRSAASLSGRLGAQHVVPGWGGDVHEHVFLEVVLAPNCKHVANCEGGMQDELTLWTAAAKLKLLSIGQTSGGQDLICSLALRKGSFPPTKCAL